MRKSLLLLLIVITCGCQQNDLLIEDLLDSQMASMKVDDLTRTLDFVFSDGRFNQKEFEEKISVGLSRWSKEVVESGEYDGDWAPHSDFTELLNEYAGKEVKNGNDLSYLNSDGYFIQQAAWLKRIGERVTTTDISGMYELQRLQAKKAGKDSAEFIDYVTACHSDLKAEDAQDLANAMRLFDWVTRNIQLLAEEKLDEEARERYRLSREEGLPDPESGIPGLGYRHYPWQTLLFGRGDFVEKAKLFILLCEQSGLEAVMLAYSNEDTQTPWLPAVEIGGKLYLFDTLLGLPIPGEAPGSVATLSEIQADGGLLTQLDLTVDESTLDETKYRVRPDQIKELVALIYASPESISHRMKFLEDRLVGTRRLRLTAKSDETRAGLPELDGLSTEIWDIAFKTQQYRNAVAEAVEAAILDTRVKAKLGWYGEEEDYINRYVIYRTARNLYFIGKFESERDSRRANAIQRFSSIMYSDEQIDGLGTNRSLLFQLGIWKDKGQNINDFNQRLRGTQELMRLVRRDSGYFLAQATFDNGNIPTSANWLKRVKENGFSERWNTGVDYLTGRSYEARKEYDRAIEHYSKGEFDQFHGNLIRARQLKEALGK